MTRNRLLLILILCFGHTAFCQIPPSPNLTDQYGKRTGHWTLLIDSSYRETSAADSAVYYGLLNYEKGKPSGKVRYFFKSTRNKLWEGYAVDFNPLPVVLEGETREYYENGHLYQTLTYSGGKLNGPCRQYYLSGQLQMEATFRQDIPEGKQIFYHENGNKEQERVFVNGKVNGEFRSYYQDGSLKKISRYKDDKEDGLVEEFYQNGQRNTLHHMMNGTLHGLWQWFRESGILGQRVTYEHGKAIGDWEDFHEDGITISQKGKMDSLGQQGRWTYYHPSGNIKEEVQFLNGVKNGSRISYYPDGRRYESGEIRNGLYQGEWLTYHEDGTLKSKVNYLNDTLHGSIELYYRGNGRIQVRATRTMGIKEGIWVFYFENGQVDGVETYQNGQLHGPVYNFHPDGRLKDSTNFHAGKLDGLYQTWHPNGQPAKRGRYVNGKLEGIWFWYYPNGKTKTIYPYVNDIMEGNFREFHPNGRLKRDAMARNGLTHGISKSWYANGQMANKGRYLNGLSNGRWIYYDSASGRRNEIRHYFNNKLHGKSVHFDENGKVEWMNHHQHGFLEEIYNISDSIEVLINGGKYEQARKSIPWLTKVMKRDGWSDSEHRRLVPKLKMLIAFNQENFEEALVHEQEAIQVVQQYKGDTSVIYHAYLSDLATIYSRLGRRIEAMDIYRTRIQFDSVHQVNNGRGYWVSVNNYATGLFDGGRKEESIRFIDLRLRAFEELGKAYRNWVMEGYFSAARFNRLITKDHDLAIEQYKTLFKWCEDSQEKSERNEELKQLAAIGMARLYHAREQYTASILWHQQAINLAESGVATDPSSYMRWLADLAQAYNEKGNLDSAIMVYDKMIGKIGDQKEFYSLQYADGSMVKSDFLQRQGKKEEALEVLEEARLILEKTGETKSNSYYNTLLEIGNQYQSDSRYTEAAKINEQAIGIIREQYGEESLFYARALNNLTEFYRDAGQTARALEVNTKALDILRRNPTESALDQARGMSYRAQVYQDMGDYRNALTANRIAIRFAEQNQENEQPFLLSTLNRQHIFLKKLGQFDSAAFYLNRSTDLAEKLYGKKSLRYLTGRIDQAELLKDQGLITDAGKIYPQVLDEMKSIFGQNSMQYLLALRDAGKFHLDQGDYQKSEPCYQEILDVLSRTGRMSTYEAADASFRLAGICEATARLTGAERFHLQAIRICEQITGKNHKDYAFYLKELGLFHLRQKNGSQKAETLLTMAVSSLAHSATGTGDALYGRYLSDLASAKTVRNKNREAEDLYTSALGILRSDSKNKEGFLIEGLQQYVAFLEQMGRYREAEKNMLEILRITEAGVGKSRTYFSRLYRLVNLYNSWGKNEMALERANEILSYADEELAPTDDLAQSIQNTMGIIQFDLRNFEAAEKHFSNFEEALHLLGKEDAVCENNLGNVLLAQNRLKEAEERFRRAAEIRKKTGARMSPLLAIRTLDNMAALYQAQNRLAEAEKQWTEILKISDRYVRENFSFMSDEEKAQFWSSLKDEYEYFNTFAVIKSRTNPGITGTMYNNQLATKAILLSASNKMRNRILRSNDTLMIENYYSWQETREQLADFYAMTEKELKQNKIKFDSLKTEVNRLEKELSMSAEELSGSLDDVRITWRDIQKQLNTDEAAVEIIRFRYFDKYLRDSIIYAALVITAETRSNPKMVLLPNGKAMEGRNLRYYKNAVSAKVDDRISYGAYWAPIQPLLTGKSRIYLSVDGVYHQLNLNTLLDSNGRYLIETTNITLVANTRDLVVMRRKAASASRTASLFGYPRYYLGKEHIRRGGEQRGTDGSETEERNVAGIAELPGTKEELERIKSILEVSNWDVTGFLHVQASERALKSVRYPGILHIATHGFFADDEQQTTTFRLGAALEESERNPLLRSGILLSGASNFIQDSYLHEDENGILTAYEASNLDLDNTDLVVLSACETGKGEIQNGEGVYGLQRAFQTAGAKSVIMSLWKVDDTATQELMTSFYRFWMSGMDKAEAFRKAQLMLKETHPSPYYWGAFVMLGE